MITLDYAQREQSSLPPKIRALLRWFAADCYRCAYSKAYARADFLRAGGDASLLDGLSNNMESLPEKERLALQLVKQLVEKAYTVTDEQMSRLVQLYGPEQASGVVLVAAYATFQDPLLHALGVSVEPDGPLPPIRVTFKKAEKGGKVRNKSPRVATQGLAPIPEKVDDPEWSSVPLDKLQSNMEKQIARRKARLPIPDAKAVVKDFPKDLTPPPDRSLRIRWCRLCYGYQPRLTSAWLGGLAAFHEDSDLDEVFHESMFWVVTRSLQCFY
jgi:hypothetical protein